VGAAVAATILALPLASVSAGGEPLQYCRAISHDAARLACYDRLAGEATSQLPPAPTSVAPPAPQSGKAAAAASPAAPTPEELFGLDPAASEEIVRRASGIGRLEEIRQQVAVLRTNPEGKLVMTLDSGQVWAQVDTLALRLAEGDQVRIRRAAMGSYLLAPEGVTRAIRVRRVR
jgi:hypothetical protein